MKRIVRNGFGSPPLSTDEKVRQGQVVQSAQSALTSTEAVRSFLNTYHETLRGRPLDLAIASAAGLRRVEQFIRAGVAEPRRHSTRTLT